MSEEVLTAAGDIAYWRQRAEQAEQRERLIASTYDGQQASYRELEALYAGLAHRLQEAEAELAELRSALNVLLAGPTAAAKARARAALNAWKEKSE